jgi:activating signal cointegrator 1
MTTIPALSLHQPWASLIAIGAKRFETRSWPAPKAMIGRRIAIHAAKTVTSLRDLCCDVCEAGWEHGVIGDFQVGYCAESPNAHRGETFIVEHSGSTWPRLFDEKLPLGAVVATATLAASIPIGWRQTSIEHIHFDTAADYTLTWSRPGADPVTCGPEYEDISDQAPYGDWTSGRWAWALDDVTPLATPVPFVGGQGFSRSVDLEAVR